MLDIILGMFIILKDIIWGLFSLIFSIFTTKPKNQENAFIELLAREAFFVDFILSLLPFIIISHYSIIAAVGVTIFMFFYIYGKKKQWYDNRNKNMPDDTLLFSYFATIIVMLVSIIYMNINTPYTYKENGTVTLTKSDLVYTSNSTGKESEHIEIEIEINNNIEKLDVYNCKPGKHKILKETLEPIWFKVNKTDYYAVCSSNIDIKKQLDGVKKIQ